MKKYLSFFILSFLVKAYSQEYVPLLKEGNKWYELNIDYNFDSPSPLSKTYIVMNGEETKNGIVYKKLFSNLYCYTSDMFIPCSATGNTDVFYKLIRENINEKKVYYYDELSNSDVLLYDFTLNIGDVIPANFPFYATNSNGNPSNILNVVKIVENGKVFEKMISKTFFADDLPYNNYESSTKIYGGIGSNLGLFYRPGRKIFEGGHVLDCFENAANGKSCDRNFLSSKENLLNLPFQLIRDKNSGRFKIFGKSNSKFLLKIYDFSGKLLAEKLVNSNENFYLNTISQSGIYMYNLTSPTEKYHGKIIIP